MISDSDRREVARKLRDWTWKSASPECLLNQLAFGDDCPGADDDPDAIDCHQCEVIAAKRLADLIEPSCDRDALLELVKELELGAQCVVGRKWPNVECERMGKNLADDYEMIVCRIRKALGAQDA